jgi:hypothetical protein
MGRRTIEQISAEEIQNQEKTYQYTNSLATSRRRVNSPTFNFFNVRLTDKRLLNLLLAVCENKKLHLPTFVEELLTSSLRSRDKIYRQYFMDDLMQVELEAAQVMKFSKLQCGTDYNAPQLERQNAGSDI